MLIQGVCISNTTPSSVTERLSVPSAVKSTVWYKRWQRNLNRKSTRRRYVRWGLLVSNVLILVAVAVFVAGRPEANTAVSQPILASSASETAKANPLDEVSSADIALTVARMGSLPETTAVTNQAQSEAADVAVAATNHNVVSKPQVVTTELKSSADIEEYTAQPGDNVTNIATKFNVTSDSIRWSNNITGEAVTVGAVLLIPPVNGIIYTVQAGDTPDGLAAKFRADREKIIAYNDAEIGGLVAGRRIIIPDGSQQLATAPLATNPAASSILGSSAVAWGSSPQYGFNGYDYGYCTWYVANRMPVPANWGNANTWSYYAPRSGWSVSKSPVKGAIGQTTGGPWGHVAVVEDVSADGTMIKYSDMNGLRGWGREGTTADWVPASRFNNYIYR